MTKQAAIGKLRQLFLKIFGVKKMLGVFKCKLTFVLLAVFITGCISVSVSQQSVPVASESNLKPGNALIIVERKMQKKARIYHVEVTDNDKVVGLLGMGSGKRHNRQGNQLVWQRPEGSMKVALTPYRGLVKEGRAVTVNVEAGRIYKFEVKMKVVAGFINHGMVISEMN